MWVFMRSARTADIVFVVIDITTDPEQTLQYSSHFESVLSVTMAAGSVTLLSPQQ
jgi:hypothetical protein